MRGKHVFFWIFVIVFVLRRFHSVPFCKRRIAVFEFPVFVIYVHSELAVHQCNIWCKNSTVTQVLVTGGFPAFLIRMHLCDALNPFLKVDMNIRVLELSVCING